MGARDLLTELDRNGFSVVSDADQIVVRPASRLTDPLRTALRASKVELLGLLNGTTPRPHALSETELSVAHALAWDEPACKRFVDRAARLVRIGFHDSDADDLSERLHLRDVTGDDRFACVECRHYRHAVRDDCANPVAAGARVRGPYVATMFQRCSGFSMGSGHAQDQP